MTRSIYSRSLPFTLKLASGKASGKLPGASRAAVIMRTLQKQKKQTVEPKKRDLAYRDMQSGKTERRAPRKLSSPFGRNQRAWCLFLCSPRAWLNFARSRTRWAPRTMRGSAARAKSTWFRRVEDLSNHKRQGAAWASGPLVRCCFQKASRKLLESFQDFL